MINLQVLGRLELHGADGGVLHSILAQPKRQAVLAYLAVAVPRGYHRRESLLGLLWPERDDEHARASLSKAVSHLRQTLGADALLSRGHAELGLDWHLVWCDAAGFEEALDRGALAEGMALYHGELLPGFHVDEAPEFDQWLERERARLRARAVQATRQLSEREEAAGQLTTSIEWARRAAALEPFDESIARRVITILDKAGDRAGALRTFEEFAAHLHSELDADPAAETIAVMESIRDRQAAAPIPAAVTSSVAASSSPSPVASDRASWRSRFAFPAIAAAGVVVLAAWAIGARSRTAAGADAPKAVVAVIPFAIEGNQTAAYLGDGMATLLAERFNQDGSLRALDAKTVRKVAHAVKPDVAGADSARIVVERLHPQFVLLGRVLVQGDSVRISAALFDSVAGREPIARAEIAGASSDIARLAGEVAWQILATQPSGPAPRHRPQIGAMTPSLVALRAFLAGEQELIAGRFAEATKAYKAAVEADTMFALAYLNMSRAANWAGDYAMTDFATQQAMRYLDRLSPLDQLRVRAWSAYQNGQPVEAERLTKLILVNEIGNAEAWYELGELRFHWGPILGWTIPEARESYEQAIAILGNDAGTMVHLARIAAAQGRTASVDSLARRAIAMGVDEPQALELRALRAHAIGDRAEAERVHAAIARLDDNAAFSVTTMVAVYTAEYATSRGVMDALLPARRSPKHRANGAIMGAELSMARGRTSDAMRALAPGANLPPARSLEYRAALAALSFRATPPAEASRLRDELLALREDGLIGPGFEHFGVNSIYPPRRGYLLAMLSLKAADTTGAMRYVAQLEGAATDTMNHAYQLAASRLIRAGLLRARGQPAQALALLGSPTELPGRVLPSVLHYPSAHERYLRGELLRDLGRFDEALRWYGTFPDPGGYDLMYLAPVHVAMGTTYERLGNRVAARASYARAVDLLAGSDAEWTPLAARARERAAALR